MPLYYTGDEDERRIIARLEMARVPIVLTEDRATYDEDYRPAFEQVDAHLQREYRDAGEIAIDDGRSLRVLVRKDLPPLRQHESDGLPCFAGAA